MSFERGKGQNSTQAPIQLGFPWWLISLPLFVCLFCLWTLSWSICLYAFFFLFLSVAPFHVSNSSFFCVLSLIPSHFSLLFLSRLFFTPQKGKNQDQSLTLPPKPACPPAPHYPRPAHAIPALPSNDVPGDGDWNYFLVIFSLFLSSSFPFLTYSSWFTFLLLSFLYLFRFPIFPSLFIRIFVSFSFSFVLPLSQHSRFFLFFLYFSSDAKITLHI